MQRHVERSAGRHGDLVVVILIGGGEGIGIGRAERQGRKTDVDLSGRGGEGIVGPVGIGQLVETVDLARERSNIPGARAAGKAAVRLALYEAPPARVIFSGTLPSKVELEVIVGVGEI